MLNFGRFLAVLTLAILLAGCSDPDKPDDLIPEDTYLNLIVEFEMAQNLLVSREDSARVEQLMRGILEKYDITLEQFERSHEWYDRDIDAQLIRYRKALDRLNEATADF